MYSSRNTIEKFRESLLHTEQEKKAENIYQEAVNLFSSFVDRDEAYRGPDGELWLEIGGGRGVNEANLQVEFRDEQELHEARLLGRWLERNNEFAINGHENRVNYIAGTGFSYSAVQRKNAPAVATAALADVQNLIDAFLTVNKWQRRQQEIIRRRDRDGEVFIRKFKGTDPVMRLRFVEPEQVRTPQGQASNSLSSFGVLTDKQDAETVLGYYVDNDLVEAREIQHRKIGVDFTIKRGVPLFYSVRHNLNRAEKILRNMAATSSIQTAIAMIRRHGTGVQKSAVESFRSGKAEATIRNDVTGSTEYFQRFAPGTVIDGSQSTEYEFPAAGIDASRYVTVLQAILRAVASRLNFPEFMLTSDASNANYSSTLVAEGPAVKSFRRWQADVREDDLELLWEALFHAAERGALDADVLGHIDIDVGLPTVETRDKVQESQCNQTYLAMGVKSKQTIAGELGLDYEQEKQNLSADPAAGA